MPKSKSQVQTFREAVRNLEADDSEKQFNEQLGKIAKAKQPLPVKESKRPSSSAFISIIRNLLKILIYPPYGFVKRANPVRRLFCNNSTSRLSVLICLKRLSNNIKPFPAGVFVAGMTQVRVAF